MKNHKQWINWQPVAQSDGKTTKIPVSPNGDKINAHDPSVWLTYDQAVACGRPLGFVLTSNDPFFFFDIDNALVNGAWNQTATDLCSWFAGAGVEVSQSNTGLHIIGRGVPSVPSAQRRKKSTCGGFDLYTEGRFIAIARPLDEWSGDVNFQVDQSLLDGIVDKYLSVGTNGSTPSEWTNSHVEGAYPISDDKSLIEKALTSESIGALFGDGSVTFKDLWANNAPVLIDNFPHDQDPERYDASRVDASLAQRLAFWTGNNCERIKSLMMMSALKRDKWDDRDDYLERTILGATARQDKWYDVGKPIEIPVEESAPVQRTGLQYLARDQQLDYFKGCVYVMDIHRIFIPSGHMLKAEQFNARYGGYIFAIDDIGDKTTKKAWEAFTESQHTSFPKVDSFAFRPKVPSGAIIDEEGIRVVNTYVPVDVKMVEGDVTPFMKHLHKLFPVERDREIITSFMAACVQYPGHKIQWAPLIQGTEGNGKTLFTRCVAYAVGHRYTHFPPAGEIGEKFNAWVFENLFIGVEDIYVPQQKLEVLEVLKPMITSDRLARRAMQQDQSMHDICANFMFNSNHKDAIRKTENDRRFAVFYTPQQSASDLTRDGMQGDYFPDLYNWLKFNEGYEKVAYYLKNYPIRDEFNPTKGCQRAPITSSTGEAVTASLGPVEQEIINRTEEGVVGFKNGWISSYWLGLMLDEMRMSRSISHARRKDLLDALGYVWHPGLNQGRSNSMLFTDGAKKSKLFIKTDSPHFTLTSPLEIATQYEKDQQ